MNPRRPETVGGRASRPMQMGRVPLVGGHRREVRIPLCLSAQIIFCFSKKMIVGADRQSGMSGTGPTAEGRPSLGRQPRRGRRVSAQRT